MCRSLISVDWRGRLYDCDFNQMLGLPLTDVPQVVGRTAAAPRERYHHLGDLLQWDPADAPITVAHHCHGCTAGSGSSCGGSLR
jgi:hypothetical protein